MQSGLEALAPVDGLLVDLAGGVLSITIDRPDSLNSVTPGVLDGMAKALACAATDPRVRVVRLGGSGRGFSSGAGIGAEDTADGYDPMDTLIEANRVIRAIVDLPRPVVAVVQGPTAGVGVSLALACDLVLAADTAFFLLAFTKIGLMPDGGASALVAAAVGRTRAMKMALLAERLPAAEAAQAGLISAVHPARELDAAAARVIERLLAGQHQLLNAHDLREGIRAFQDKRPPVFTDHA